VCGVALAAPASALGAGWVYTLNNDERRGQNAVLALEYDDSGRTSPINVRGFPTRGTGAGYIRNRSVGALAGDQQVILSPDRRFLFAVNQGSNTVAVFSVDQATGSLAHVAGSPFPSGGNAPISVGFNGRHAVVVNHGTRPPFAPAMMMPPAETALDRAIDSLVTDSAPPPPRPEAPMPDFGDPNYTSFEVSSEGGLRRIGSVPAVPGPTQAGIAPNGRNVFSTSFYTFLIPGDQEIQSLTLSPSGRLAEAGPPTGFPDDMTENLAMEPPPFLPPGIEHLAFGVAFHPTEQIVYILGAANQRVAIYRYDDAGALRYLGKVDHRGYAACWLVLTSDGRYMYSANTVTQDITVFRVSPNGERLSVVEVEKMPSTATVFNLAVDPDDNFLYAVGGHEDPDGPRPQEKQQPDGSFAPAPADGNFVEAFRIGSGGRLSPISTTALPLRSSQIPYGLAVLEQG
jgi:DNA-binding beta-propeller fold protein YncE